jgi:hypothetical protein
MSTPKLTEIITHLRPLPEAEKSAAKIHIVKTKQMPKLDEKTTDALIDFVQFAAKFLKLQNRDIHIRLVHAAPEEPITTGAYEPATKHISSIAEGRNFIDYCRTIAHEMTHMKQDYEGRVEDKNQEIGGKIEDEANALSGQIVKSYLKNHLTAEQKKIFGLGTF